MGASYHERARGPSGSLVALATKEGVKDSEGEEAEDDAGCDLED